MHPGHVDVVEDDNSLRESLQDLLVFAGYQVRAWSSAVEFLDNLPQTAPAVVITDMHMPGMSGVEMHIALSTRGRSMPVIYISGESSVEQGIEAMKHGAYDFLVKPFRREKLLKAVSTAMEQARHQMRMLIEQVNFDESIKHLSPREREVLALLLDGFNNQEIVDKLHISLPTAKQYKSQIMRKLGVRSLSQLMQLGRKQGGGPQS